MDDPELRDPRVTSERTMRSDVKTPAHCDRSILLRPVPAVHSSVELSAYLVAGRTDAEERFRESCVVVRFESACSAQETSERLVASQFRR